MIIQQGSIFSFPVFIFNIFVLKQTVLGHFKTFSYLYSEVDKEIELISTEINNYHQLNH